MVGFVLYTKEQKDLIRVWISDTKFHNSLNIIDRSRLRLIMDGELTAYGSATKDRMNNIRDRWIKRMKKTVKI